jgi:hypothetical protein
MVRLSMATNTQEAELSGFEYVGPDTTRADLYEIIVNLVEPVAGRRRTPAIASQRS